MSMPSRMCVSVAFLAVAAVLAGCGGGDLPELGTVTGKVTLDDKPLVGALVVFEPEHTRSSEGVTDTEGRYELTYKPDVKGAAVGNHVVRISKFEQDAEAEQQGEEAAAIADEHRKNLIPAAYNIRSKLSADVKAGSNTFDFPLSSTEEAGGDEDEKEEEAAAEHVP